jgi:hypothetical protein
MLMSRMRRCNMVVMVVAILALATQPILHNHSLIPDGIGEGGSLSPSTIQCAFCATNKARATVSAPDVSTPLAIPAEFVDPTAPAFTVEAFGSISSRAPPAAA